MAIVARPEYSGYSPIAVSFRQGIELLLHYDILICDICADQRDTCLVVRIVKNFLPGAQPLVSLLHTLPIAVNTHPYDLNHGCDACTTGNHANILVTPPIIMLISACRTGKPLLNVPSIYSLRTGSWKSDLQSDHVKHI